MNIHYFQHVSFESLGSIKYWVNSHGHRLTRTRFYAGDKLPMLESLDWLIILGGPMGIFDYHNYPWLLDEKKFIEKTINAGKTVLGICLGAQLVADVLGAKISKNHYKEIGWYPIQMTKESFTQKPFNAFPYQLNVFHWHGDTFDIPKNAIHLARSTACENQAYIYDKNIIGLQFHIEIMEENARQIIANCGHELVDEPYIQSSEAMISPKSLF